MTPPGPAAPTPPPPPPPAQMMQMITAGRMISHAIGVAARLDLATHLGDGACLVEELARRTESNADALYRLLRALASVGIFAEGDPSSFRNTPLSSTLRSDVPMSSRALALFFCHDIHIRGWLGLDYSVKTGHNGFQHVHGASPFELAARDPEIGAVFDQAMTAFSAAMGPAIADAIDLAGIDQLGDQLVDIGGGQGALLCAVLHRRDDLRGVLFDLPHVVSGAKAVIEPAGLAARIEVIGGDFFQAVPSAAAYLMKSVLHDWSDADALRILQTIHRTARPGARLFVAEAVMRPGNDPDITKLMDLEMLVMAGGRERTSAQWTELLRAGGFRLERVVPTASPLCVLEATRV